MTIYEGSVAPKECPRHSPRTLPKGENESMDYFQKLELIDKHLAEHPKDYQAVISRLKTYSDAVEHQMYLRKIERLKRVAEFRKRGQDEE